jgi:hypothetical protein
MALVIGIADGDDFYVIDKRTDVETRCVVTGLSGPDKFSLRV